LRTAGNAVTDNHIYDGGKIWPSAIGILLRHAADNLIAHNHIHDLYYTGISVGWVWGYHPSAATGNRIEANHIHHIGRGLLSDMGGIYTLGPSPGTVLAGNVIHDVESYGYGGWGIYTDEGSTAILIENNIVYRTKTGGFHQHYGKENVVRNNVFAFSRTDQIQRSRAEPHLSFTFERNIVYWTEGTLLGKTWKDDQFRMDFNCYWNAAGQPVTFAGLSLEEWRTRDHDVHSRRPARPVAVTLRALGGCFITPSPLMGEGRGEGEIGLGKPTMPPHPGPLPPGEMELRQPLNSFALRISPGAMLSLGESMRRVPLRNDHAFASESMAPLRRATAYGFSTGVLQSGQTPRVASNGFLHFGQYVTIGRPE
jgi:parallel beta-helix repeat protein